MRSPHRFLHSSPEASLRSPRMMLIILLLLIAGIGVACSGGSGGSGSPTEPDQPSPPDQPSQPDQPDQPSPPDQPEPDEPPVSQVVVPWSLEDLREGDIDRIIHCSGPVFNPEEHDGYIETFTETPPFMYRVDLSLSPSDRTTSQEKLAGLRTILETWPLELPYLSLTFTSVLPDGTVQGLDAEVAGGEMDDLILDIAAIVRDTGLPIFLRIGQEFNGFWNGYSPDTYRLAFRRIVDLFRQVGADNAITDWNYKAWAGDPTPYIEFYPGDDYVDWWSIDLFSADFDVPAVKMQVDAFIADATARGMPLFIPESAPNFQDLEAPATWGQWYEPFFELVRDHPNIKGFCYSNRDFAKNDASLADWGNMRIDQSEALAPLYQEELRSPIYQHRIGE